MLGSGALVVVVVVALILVLGAATLVVVVGTRRRRDLRGGVDALPEDLMGLRQEVAALRAEAAGALRHLAVVRYDAFNDMGGHLSWSLALLDNGGDGVVLTSIHGRSETRTYAKNVAAWTSPQQLSPEEEEAVTHARAAG
jgi:Protein of unknown function (DUF4446)